MLALALAACGSSATPAPSANPTAAPAAAATRPAAAPSPTLPAGMIRNPIFGQDFPDPFILKVDGTYYAYSTNARRMNVPVLTSTDLRQWTPAGDAMPKLSWAQGSIWAPEVLALPGGRYILYYTGASNLLRQNYSNAQCVGRAVADSPAGPFVDPDMKPFVCQVNWGGTIDASPFRDRNGALYLLFKSDGNCCRLTTYIYSQRLSADGMKLQGEPVRLEKNDQPWEGSVVEAPQMWLQDGKYYLFYSGGNYASRDYSVGYATCSTPTGPCKDAPSNPILTSRCDAAGPGHETLFRDGKGQTWMAYHAWPADAVNVMSPGRLLWMDRVQWKDGKPAVQGPTCKPQPAPVP